MKRNLILRLIFHVIVILGFLMAIPGSGYAQLSYIGNLNISSFLQAGSADANLLAKSYLNPVGKGFGATLNTGWITSSNTHKFFGFDLSVRVGASLVPKSDQTFNVAALSLQDLSYQSGPEQSPTLSGPSGASTTFSVNRTINGQKYPIDEFTMPKGIGYAVVPGPMAQLSVGLVAHTDVMIRYVPKTNVPNGYGNVQLFGIGIHHDINQWLPGGSKLPVDLSFFAGYTSLKTNTPLDITPEYNTNASNPYSSDTWSGQAIAMETTAYTIDVVAGKSLPLISLFVGAGYEQSSMKITTPGNYPFTIADPNNPGQMTVSEINDPINLTMNGVNSYRGLLGLQLKLAILHINAEYVIAKYRVLSGGISLSIR